MPGAEENSSISSLKAISFFKDFSDEILVELEQACTLKSYNEGEQVIEYLEESDDVFFVVSGKAKVIIYSVSGKALAFREINPGDIFGEFSAIDGRQQRSASVEAVEPCVLVNITSAVFWDLLRNEESFMRAVVRHLVKEIRYLTKRVYEYSTQTVPHRIRSELLRIAENNLEIDNAITITTFPTHEEIANLVSTHRQAVTSELNSLSQSGLIEQQGRVLVIKDVQSLRDMVREAFGE